MGRRKKVEPYTLPDSLLAQISEHCPHGFMLFVHDNEDSFRPYIMVDGDIPFKALKDDVLKYLNVISDIEKNQMLMALVGGK